MTDFVNNPPFLGLPPVVPRTFGEPAPIYASPLRGLAIKRWSHPGRHDPRCETPWKTNAPQIFGKPESVLDRDFPFFGNGTRPALPRHCPSRSARPRCGREKGNQPFQQMCANHRSTCRMQHLLQTPSTQSRHKGSNISASRISKACWAALFHISKMEQLSLSTLTKMRIN